MARKKKQQATRKSAGTANREGSPAEVLRYQGESAVRVWKASGVTVPALVRAVADDGADVELPNGIAGWLPLRVAGCDQATLVKLTGKRVGVVVDEPGRGKRPVFVTRIPVVRAAEEQKLARLQPGTTVRGTVEKCFSDGSVRVVVDEPALRATVSADETAWSGVHALKVGDRVDVVVVTVDAPRRRAEASLRRAAQPLWEAIARSYRPGDPLEVRVAGPAGPGSVWIQAAPGVVGSASGVDQAGGATEVWVRVDHCDPDAHVLHASGESDLEPLIEGRHVEPLPGMHSAWARRGWEPAEAYAWGSLAFGEKAAAAWRRTGLPPGESRRWADLGLRPEDVDEVRSRRLDLAEAGAWRTRGFPPSTIRAWQEAGFPDGDAALPWRSAGPERAPILRDGGVSPTLAAAGLAHDMAVDEIIGWAFLDDAGTMLAWRRNDFTAEEAASWIGSGFGSPSMAAPWKAAGVPPSAASAWRGSGVPPDEVAAWASCGFGPAGRAEWTSVGFKPRRAEEWHRAGIAPAEASEWAPTGIRPEAIASWMREGFSPAAASSWHGRGFEEPGEASMWRRAFAQPKPARRWLQNGWTDPAAAAGWAAAGWSPRSAADARSHGLSPSDGDVPSSSVEPRPCPRRPATSRDVFGSPRDEESLRDWVRRAGTPQPRASLHSAFGYPGAAVDAARWSPPDRWNAADAALVGRAVAGTLGSTEWERSTLSRLKNAVPFLFEPTFAAMCVEGEPVPAEHRPRVPFRHTLLLLGAPFRLADADRNTVGCEAPDAGFDRWFDALAARGGALVGVGLRSTGEMHVADDVIWLLSIDGHLVAAPGFLAASRLGTVVTNLIAGLMSVHRPGSARPAGRAPTGHGTNSARPRSDDTPHVVDIRFRRSESTGTGYGGPRQAHVRRAHWHGYWVGPKPNQTFEYRFILPTFVGGVPPRDNPTRVYRLPRLR